MKPWTLKTSLALTLVMLSVPFSAFGRGGQGSGGGNICYYNSEAQLLDLVVNEKWISPGREPGLQLPEFSGTYYSYNPMTDARMKDMANRYLRSTPFRGYPALAQLFDLALTNSWFFVTRKRFTGPVGAVFISPAKCNAGNVRAVIGSNTGIKFVTRDWNQLSLNTQFYVLKHEAWRYVTQAFGLYVTDGTLQELTRLDMGISGADREAFDNAYIQWAGLDRRREVVCRAVDVMKKTPAFATLEGQHKEGLLSALEPACKKIVDKDRHYFTKARADLVAVAQRFGPESPVRVMIREAVGTVDDILDQEAMAGFVRVGVKNIMLQAEALRALQDPLVLAPHSPQAREVEAYLDKLISVFPTN